MPTTLIVPLVGPHEDTHAVGEVALPVARGLASQLYADVVLLSALELVTGTRYDPGLWMRPDVTVRMPETSDAALERYIYLEAIAPSFPGARVRAAVVDGDAAAAICTAAAGLERGVIVMASHARRGLRRALLGSVTASVIGQTSRPVVVVPVSAVIPSPFAMRRVVVPLDGSLLAEQVLDLPFVPELSGAVITLVQVIEPLTFHYGAISDDYYAMAWEEARQYLSGVAERVTERGIGCAWVVRRGYPAEQIAQLAAEVAADAIALATHGRGGLRRVLLGSVAEALVQTGTLPLLLLRPGEAELRASRQEREAVHPASPAGAEHVEVRPRDSVEPHSSTDGVSDGRGT